jgi:ABC-type antimicrobial peptide transport system permease subunit
MEMYRILRAVGTPVVRLRIMVFCEVFVRVFISVLIGIVMGVIFSVAFAHQIESLLMVQMPSIELSLVMIMASVLLVIFSVTVVYSTKDLETMTVAQMVRA